jgi:hypothetical protein
MLAGDRGSFLHMVTIKVDTSLLLSEVRSDGGVHHRVHIFPRDETGFSVSAHSAGAYTATLLVMVNVIKRDGRAPPTLTSLG